MKSSIALTTYNGSKFITELLDSIRNQTRQPDEVVIIDDVSTDDTVSIVSEYIKSNGLKNWSIIRNESNLGWKKNFRKVMSKCTGDIVFFCDQDDIWHQDKVEVMCSVFEDSVDIGVLISNYVLLSQGSSQTKGQKGSERDDGVVEHLTGEKRIGTIARPGCTYAFTKEIGEMMLKYDIEDCSHDHAIYNLGLITDSLYIINRQLIDFRRHTSNASTYKIKFGRARKSIEAHERVEICEMLLKYCDDGNAIWSRGVKVSRKAIERRKSYYQEREDIFKHGNLFSMVGFVLVNAGQYWSLRDMVVDLVAMVK